MSYSVDELFRFEKTAGGYSAVEFLKKDDPTITEIEIPVEYNGLPVRCLVACFKGAKHIKRAVIPPSVISVDFETFCECKSLETAELSEGLRGIGPHAFYRTSLKSIVLPKSLTLLHEGAFDCCQNLESVIFNSGNSEIPNVSFGGSVFRDCFKLPADITLMGLVNSCDLGKPFSMRTFYDAFQPESSKRHGQNEHLKYTRPDVFELAIKNDCFRSVDIAYMLRFFIKNRDTKSLRFVEDGLLKTREDVDKCIESSARHGETELTAYLLELKNRKFGFDDFGKGDNFEL